MPAEQNEFTPKFSYTREVSSRFEQKGLARDVFATFTKNLDSYLEVLATRPSLIAFGLLIVPAKEGMAGYLVEEGGFVVDAIGYWVEPQKDITAYDYEFMDLDFNSSKLAPAAFQSCDLSEFPDLKSLEESLKDAEVRRSFTLSGANCDFWGFVTTDKLRQEMESTPKV